MEHSFYTPRDLTVEGLVIPKDSLIATVKTDLPIDRVIKGMHNNLLEKREPVPAEPVPKTAAPAASVPKQPPTAVE